MANTKIHVVPIQLEQLAQKILDNLLSHSATMTNGWEITFSLDTGKKIILNTLTDKIKLESISERWNILL